VRARRGTLAAALLWWLGAIGVPTLAAQGAPVRVNYVDASLPEVIRSLASSLGVNVVLSDVPDKRITFETPQPVPAKQLGAVLEAILESQGLVLVQSGPVAQVMPDAKRPGAGPVHVGKTVSDPPPLGLITQIVPLDFVQADEAVALLKQTASRAARVETVPHSNAVMITDRGINVARDLELLASLDVKTGGEAGLHTYVYPLKHASAEELAATLSSVFGVSAPAPVERSRVKALEDKSLSSELETFQRREQESLAQRRATPIPLQNAPAPGAAPPVEDSVEGGPAATPGALVGQTTVVPDQATNSLVIRTAPPNFALLKETIDQLDVRPRQVLLEVLIAEVELDRGTSYGINWQLFTQRLVSGGDPRNITGGFGLQDFGDTALTSTGGLGVRVVSLADVSVRAILQALASRANVRVLSTPRILALNNEQARILVGSEVPFNQSTRTGLDVVVDQTVQFRKVGTQLTIVPTVNQDGYVTFRILQEVSALTAQTIQAALNAPVISTREAETSAIVKTGRTIIIGGLIGENQQVLQSGVPILQDIPVLGGLFRSKQTTHTRTELALFVTPHVVTSDDEADALLQQQRDKFRLSRQAVDSALALPRRAITDTSRTSEKALLNR
jgi:general secretion pathway protein D